MSIERQAPRSSYLRLTPQLVTVEGLTSDGIKSPKSHSVARGLMQVVRGLLKRVVTKITLAVGGPTIAENGCFCLVERGDRCVLVRGTVSLGGVKPNGTRRSR